MTTRGKLHWIRVQDLTRSEKCYQLRERAKKDAPSDCKLSWINKEFDDMTDPELRSISILSVVSDYMCKSHLRARDLFGRYDSSHDGEIDAKEMMRGIESLEIENGSPSFEEVWQMV